MANKWRVYAGAMALCRYWNDDIDWIDAVDQAKAVIEAADKTTRPESAS